MTDRRIAVFACNRSGSTVLFELLRRIRDREGDTSTSETPFQRAIERWRTIFEPAPSFTATGACRLGTTDYVAASAGRFVLAVASGGGGTGV